MPLIDALASLSRPTIDDYVVGAAEYVRAASSITASMGKAAQIRLSHALAIVTLADLRDKGVTLRMAFAGERPVGGGLRTVKADVSEMTATDGLTLAVEIKPVHLAVGRAIWNRFGDIRTFRHGHITKMGPAAVRFVLGEAAQVAKTKPPFADPYESIRRRRGKQIATTAVARRLLSAAFSPSTFI